MARRSSRHQAAPVTWAQAVRDVLIRSMDKGQGPAYLLGLIVIVILIKMPGERVAKLADELVAGLKSTALVGWVLVGIVLFLWGAYAKRQRRIVFLEQKRIGEEKSRLQERLLGDSVESSQG